IVQQALGDSYRDLGQYDQALPYYEDALRYHQGENATVETAALLTNIGDLYRAMGDYDRALPTYEEASSLLQGATEPARAIATLTGIGKVQRALHKGDLALATFEEALALAKTMDAPVEEAKQMLNVGNAYAALGQVEEAISMFERARAVAENEQDQALLADALEEFGRVYRGSSQYELALDVLQQALTIQEQLGDIAGQADTLNNLGGVYLNIFQPERALEPYQRALAAAQSVYDVPLAIEILAGLGQAYENEGNVEQAITTYEAAIATGSGHPIELETYQRLLKLLWDNGDLGAVFTYMEQALASSFLDEKGNPWLDIRSKVAPELAEREQELRLELVGLQSAIETENKKPLRQRNDSLLTELSAQYTALTTDYQDVLARLREQDPEYSTFLGINVLSLDELRNNVLDEDTTLIQYFILRKQAVAWVIDKERAVLVPLDITYTELVNQIGDFYEKMTAQADSSQEVSSLHARLFTPLQSFVRNNNLVIVPHSV
ncbi:MAG: tetratricopeptide repeat protein, partial [Caldilineaceae bacterium]|nr:tetratricopeptide repeat protein [Caldilineaceae bacterium]